VRRAWRPEPSILDYMKQNKITPIYVAARRPIDIAVLITEELDETAWDVQDKVDEGLIPEQAYLDAFSKARAVAAVGCALETDPLQAALESVYEAQAATCDLVAIRTAIRDL
jgi:hypothetical protein